jgi:hypothetical protein
MSSADGKSIVQRYDRLKSDASTHFTHCDELAPFIAPSRVGITSKRQPGDKQTREVYDSTSMLAAELMAQFVAGQIINPGQLWGTMRLKHPRQRSQDAINEWLEECRDRQLAQYDASMFYAEGVESLTDWGLWHRLSHPRGTPAPPNATIKALGFYYQAKKTGRFLIVDGADGFVIPRMTNRTLTAKVMAERWGRQTPEKVKQALTARSRRTPSNPSP